MFFLVGPTAAGKSEIAVEVALRCGAEIVSADAFQVYDGLELLTAKPAAHLRAKVPHHLIGEIPLREKFDVARYRQMALERVREIEARGKRALVAGGTGLYVRALTHGLSELPEADPALRRELDAMTLAQLQKKYAALDPLGIARIDSRKPPAPCAGNRSLHPRKRAVFLPAGGLERGAAASRGIRGGARTGPGRTPRRASTRVCAGCSTKA